jgi:hypothetical protein
LGTNVPTVRAVLNSWGPGRFDAELFLDGKAFRPDGKSASVLIPPAFGLAGVNLHTWTGWGGISHWNAFVANLEMHGQGTFFDPRLDDATRFPIAARNGFGHVRADEDLITAQLPALQIYQLSIPVPSAPRGSFDRSSAKRGEAVFNGRGKCADCHTPPLYTEPGWNMHTGAEIGIDEFQANRAPDGRYRTSPLRGLWTHAEEVSTTTRDSPPSPPWSTTTIRISHWDFPAPRSTTWSNSSNLSASVPGRNAGPAP